MEFTWEEHKKPVFRISLYFNSFVSDVRHCQGSGSRIHPTDLAGPDAPRGTDGTYTHKREHLLCRSL